MKILATMGQQDFIVSTMFGTDRLSEGYSFELLMYSINELKYVPIGQQIDLEVDDELTWTGKIFTWSFLNIDMHGRFCYKCSFCSSFQYLCKSKMYLICQDISLKDLIEQFMKKNQVKYKIHSNAARQYEYFVQYQDSDQQIIRYLAASNGMYYYFEHTKSVDVLVFASQNQNMPLVDTLQFVEVEQNIVETKHSFISEWKTYNDARLKTCKSYGFNINNPDFRLHSDHESSVEYAHGIEEKYVTDVLSEIETTMQARNFIDAQNTRTVYCTTTRNPKIHAGNRISLTGTLSRSVQPYDGEYFALEVKHEYGENTYRNECVFMKSSEKFVPPAVELNKIYGLQTATVIGPNDKAGRVKVQFHWGDNTSDAKSAAYVSVLQSLAGNGWGALVLPRVGQRIAILFECGDPSRPFICGCFYDGAHVPPFDAENKPHYSLLKTQSFDTEAQKFHEIRISDEAHKESIRIYSCKDMEEEIEDTKYVRVNTGSMKINIEEGDFNLNLHNQSAGANHSVQINKGNSKLNIKHGDHQITIHEGNSSISIRSGNIDLKIENGKLNINVPELNLNAQNVVINSKQLELQAAQVEMNSEGKFVISGNNVEIKSSTDLVISSVAELNLTSSQINLN